MLPELITNRRFDQPGERHIGMATHHRLYLLGQVGEHLSPTLEPRVDEYDFLVVAWRSVTEDHWAEAVDLQRDRVGQAEQQGDMVAIVVRPPRR